KITGHVIGIYIINYVTNPQHVFQIRATPNFVLINIFISKWITRHKLDLQQKNIQICLAKEVNGLNTKVRIGLWTVNTSVYYKKYRFSEFNIYWHIDCGK
ncbi:hypothetical protein ACJX0J_037536, partial [Zea mays]